MKQTLKFTNRVHVPFSPQPIRYGVPWPKGAVTKETRLVARDEKGALIPVASRVLNAWPDGSAQWTLLDLALDMGPSATREISIETADGAAAALAPANPVVVRQDACGITVENGLTSLTVPNAAGESLVEGWEAGHLDAIITDTDGTSFSAARCATRKVWVEDANPLCAIVRIDGKHQAADGKTLLDFWIRFTLTAGRRDVKITYHYHNFEKPEPGIFLRTMVLELRTSMPPNAERAILHSNRTRATRPEPYRLPEDFELCSSNTQDLANYPATHKGLTGGGMGRVFIRQLDLLRDDPMKKPWYVRDVVDFKFESKDPPEAHVWSYLGLASPKGSLLVCGGNMSGLHPKSLSIEGSVVRYAVWPQWAGTMDITQGEGRTLDLFVGPLPPDATDMQMITQYFSWEFGSIFGHWGTQATVHITPDIEHIRKCEVFQIHKLPPYLPRDRFLFERKVQAQWAPDGPVPATGHWNYGDVFNHGWTIGVNNEEMVGHVWFQEYLRSGRPGCFETGLAQAQHIADVDICAYSSDPYQNGGMCSHGPRHNHTAAYPSHMWFTEMLFAYALTGDAEFKKAAMRVCDNLCFWVNDEFGLSIITSDGRESGQPLINLSFTYQFAPEQRYMNAMKKIYREAFINRVKKHGSLIYMKPRESFPLLAMAGYGEWAAWEGMFYVCELTGDKEFKDFLLSQLEWRLTEEKMATVGIFRDTDYNSAAYAYYLTGDRQWLDRVARAFRGIFRTVDWPFGYIKTMFFIKLAFEHGIIKDDDILLS